VTRAPLLERIRRLRSRRASVGVRRAPVRVRGGAVLDRIRRPRSRRVSLGVRRASARVRGGAVLDRVRRPRSRRASFGVRRAPARVRGGAVSAPRDALALPRLRVTKAREAPRKGRDAVRMAGPSLPKGKDALSGVRAPAGTARGSSGRVRRTLRIPTLPDRTRKAAPRREESGVDASLTPLWSSARSLP
jgi:hypothetical protein